jgi:hypothetical protein
MQIRDLAIVSGVTAKTTGARHLDRYVRELLLGSAVLTR